MKYKILFICLFIGVITSSGQIVINEINYKDAIGFESKDWIELYNNSASSVDVSNWVFKDDDDLHEFVIPNGTTMLGGSYLVLVQFLADFQTVHPTAGPVLGDFTFGMSGGGELIRLFDNNGVLMDFVMYDDVAPWPTEPDGNGPTLELTNPNLDNALASSWLASVPPNGSHGTPGAVNSTLNLGIEDFSTVNFSVYPNPMVDETTISISKNVSQVKLTVYDLLGREVTSNTSESNSILLQKGNLTSGVYILKISSDNYSGFGTKKLIVH